jgi:DNA-binding NarL/FixJ family response regulator
MLQGFPARIAERLWPRAQVMESQRKRLLDATAHVLAEPGLRGQDDHERGDTRVGRSTSCEPFNGVEDLTLLAAIGALPHSVGEPSGGVSGHLAVVLGRFDALVSRGLMQILGEDKDLRIIGAGLDRAALEHTVASEAPELAVLDEATAREPSVLEHLKAAQPTIGIVVLAHRPTVAYAIRLLAMGASCLAKDVSAADILAAVHIAADGRRVFADVDGHMVDRSHPAVSASLTPREVEVLEYLSMGQTHAEIAHALQLGIETIRTHSAHIRAKFGVRSKRELIGLTIPIQAERQKC